MAVEPHKFAICLDTVTAYYDGPQQSKCCEGWKKTLTKHPFRDKDTNSFVLDLCKNGSREVVVEMNLIGHDIQLPVTLNDDLPKCVTTTPPPITASTESTTHVPRICRRDFYLELHFEQIHVYSKPLPELGKYSLSWSQIAEPKGFGICLDKVIAFYNGPNRDKPDCCDGWTKTKPMYPIRYADTSPVILDLCGNDSRLVSVYFQHKGQG